MPTATQPRSAKGRIEPPYSFPSGQARCTFFDLFRRVMRATARSLFWHPVHPFFGVAVAVDVQTFSPRIPFGIRSSCLYRKKHYFFQTSTKNSSECNNRVACDSAELVLVPLFQTQRPKRVVNRGLFFLVFCY
jgi:hypothetical protein